MTALYVPGTSETDPSKTIMALQNVAGITSTNTTNIATNTADIATANTNIAANTAAIAAIIPATKANQQAGSSNAVYVTPLHQQDHDSAAKAWVYFTLSGTTVTIQASYNVTSVVRNSAGVFTITFTTAFASANYAAFGQAESNSLNMSVTGVPSARTASVYQIGTINDVTGGVADPGGAQLVCYGRQ